MSKEGLMAGNGGVGDYFSVTPDELAELFDNEKIHNGTSLGTVKEWGGFPGLERKLKVELGTGLSADLTDLSARE